MSASSSTFIVPTRFTAVDMVSPTVRSMAGKVASSTQIMNAGIARQERLFRKLTPGIGNAAKQLLNYASAGAVLGAAAMEVKSVLDYETAIKSLQAVTMVSNEELGVMKTQIESLAVRTKKSATDVAGSFEVIGSAMSQYLKDPKALAQISEAGIVLAKASRQELIPTLENLTSIMNQFNLTADKSTDVINRLTAGEIVGNLKTAEVSGMLQEFGGVANAANIGLSESIALVEALGKQMSKDKIGVGARNLITIMDAAKGASKGGRRAIRATGVDINYISDRTHTLGQRLREFSKIMRSQTAPIKVFGQENIEAAQTIFNQLQTYDEYLAKIKVTNEAQKQAAINSNTLKNRLVELKNKFENYITIGDGATSMLERFKGATTYITDNMESIITIGTNVIKFYALWKGAILLAKSAAFLANVQLGIQSVLIGSSILALKGNIVALKAQTIAMRVEAAMIAIAAGDLAAVNLALAMTPIGWFVVGTLAAATAVYALSENEKRLNKEHQKNIDLRVASHINKEAGEVNNLVWAYYKLGLSIKEATKRSLTLRLLDVEFKQQQNQKRINQTAAALNKENDKIYISDLFAGRRTNTGARSELSRIKQELIAIGTSLTQDRLDILSEAQMNIDKGILPQRWRDVKKTNAVGAKEDDGMDWQSIQKIYKVNQMFSNQSQSPQKVIIEFKNAPPGTTATTSGGLSIPTSH